MTGVQTCALPIFVANSLDISGNPWPNTRYRWRPYPCFTSSGTSINWVKLFCSRFAFVFSNGSKPYEFANEEQSRKNESSMDRVFME